MQCASNHNVHRDGLPDGLQGAGHYNNTGRGMEQHGEIDADSTDGGRLTDKSPGAGCAARCAGGDNHREICRAAPNRIMPLLAERSECE